jgi:hypothetical protein
MSPTQLRSCRRGALAVLFCTVLLPAAGFAQNWDVAGTAGVGIPFSDLGDTHDPGFSASLSATRWFGPRYGIRIGGAGNFLGGASSPIPGVNFADLKLWHYNIGPEVDFLPPRDQKIKWHGTVGIGATTAQADGGGDSTDFTLNLGTTLEYPINEYFRIIGGPSLYVIFADDTQMVLPITAGFRYLFSSAP